MFGTLKVKHDGKVLPQLVKPLMAIGCLLAMLLPFHTNAEQIEVTGSAKIVNNNIDKAREQAINQALNYASLRSGVSFNSQQQISQGSLTQDTFSMQRMGSASNIELVSELVSGNSITVVLSLYIDDASQVEQCQQSALKAAILLPQADIRHPVQLNYGHLNNFPEALTLRMGEILNNQSQTSFAKVHANERLYNKNDLVNFKGYRIPSWLGELTDTQYILKTDILDMSTEPYTSSFLGLVEHTPLRQFTFKLQLYHGISGEVVWSETLSTNAEWDFKRQETVMPNSQRFWSSAYGQAIYAQLQQSIISMDDALNCRPVLGQIVAKQGDRIIINLGRNNGIKLGDKLQIVLQKNIPDRLNNMRALVTENTTKVSVDQVSEDTATAVIENIDSAENIQIQDIAIKL
ncbi:flagellar assembly protein FlgT [Shewanella gaetbuli]